MTRDSSELKGIERVPEAQWVFYERILEAARGTGIPFALGGAFAWATYTGYLRNTKDIDLYIPESSKNIFIEAVRNTGATDYFDVMPYDRGWIFRSYHQGSIADLIWAMANYVRPVDDDYFTGTTKLNLRGKEYAVLPAEELIMNKLYIMQRGRCDWFDIFNVLYCVKGRLDWRRLITKMGDDIVLLTSALNVFLWVCPSHARYIPEETLDELGVVRLRDSPDIIEARVRYLDSRPWFIPMLKDGEHPFAEGD